MFELVVTGLTGSASGSRNPPGKVGWASLQYTSRTLVVARFGTPRRFAGGTSVTRSTERGRCAKRLVLPLVLAVDDRAFLDLCRTARRIAAHVTDGARAAATGGREIADEARRTAVLVQDPSMGLAIAYLPDVALALVLTCSRALRSVTIAVGFVTVDCVEACRLEDPSCEIRGTRLQRCPITIVVARLARHRLALTVGCVAQGYGRTGRTLVPVAVGPAGLQRCPTALVVARRADTTIKRCGVAVGCGLTRLVSGAVDIAQLEAGAVAFVLAGRARGGNTPTIDGIAKGRGSAKFLIVPFHTTWRALLELRGVVRIAAIRA